MKWPARYFAGLTPDQKTMRAKELIMRRNAKHPQLSKSNTFAKPKKSQWTSKFHKFYPDLKFNKNNYSRRFHIPRNILNIVYDKGLKAWKTSGSRPGATAHQWAIARIYKFILLWTGKVKNNVTKKDPNRIYRLKEKRR
jgi:hypothetical protein